MINKNKFYFFLIFIGLISCQQKEHEMVRNISNVEIIPLDIDTLLNVRAMEIWGDSVVVATSLSKIKLKLPGSLSFREIFSVDTMNKPNFRSLAIAGKSIFSLGIGSPALLYKNGKVVYREENEKAFYDSMEFWNEKEGIAIGDPTEDCLSIIITRDGGDTWHKMACSNLPKSKEGEGAFAASDTNISILGDKTWVATGGKSSRIWYSADKGNTWEVYDTPIVQGKETTGMYSIDFYSENKGIAIGGDYTLPNENSSNKILTEDGGRTWEIIGKDTLPGYRSCVKYIPGSNGKELVAIGFNGIDYSNNGGYAWKHLSDEGYYTIRFQNDTVAYAAGNGRISKLIFR